MNPPLYQFEVLASSCNLTTLWICISHPLFLYTCSSGSHIENWHSVLRNGLVNASYTKLQVRSPGQLGFFKTRLHLDSACSTQSRLSSWSILTVNGCQIPFVPFWNWSSRKSKAHRKLFTSLPVNWKLFPVSGMRNQWQQPHSSHRVPYMEKKGRSLPCFRFPLTSKKETPSCFLYEQPMAAAHLLPPCSLYGTNGRSLRCSQT